MSFTLRIYHQYDFFFKIPFFYQQMRLLLNIQNVKIYIKISYIHSIMTIIWI